MRKREKLIKREREREARGRQLLFMKHNHVFHQFLTKSRYFTHFAILW